MKKLSKLRKQYLLDYSKRKCKHERKRKLIRKMNRIISMSIHTRSVRAKNFRNDKKNAKKKIHIAPSVFSLTKNTEMVINFFDQVGDDLKKGMPVVFDFSGIKEMGPETLTYLCALITNSKYTRKTPLRGNSPDLPEIKEMMKNSGFYKLMKNGLKSHKNLPNRLINWASFKQSNPQIATEVIESANNHTFGVKRIKSQNIHPLLIEAMDNTHNHANFEKDGEKFNWWLLAHQEPTTKVTKFCFLDVGIGIFDSLTNKYNENIVESWINHIKPVNQAGLLKKIFSGERLTSTKRKERGWGIYKIREFAKTDSNIRNFTLISNSIVARLEYNKIDFIEKINRNFRGTLYYWELIPNE